MEKDASPGQEKGEGVLHIYWELTMNILILYTHLITCENVIDLNF